uniref:Uncharacterized protein n=1 Tax=Avena sativa TaxID=4498 RepID=A0ACD5XD77_AVESA
MAAGKKTMMGNAAVAAALVALLVAAAASGAAAYHVCKIDPDSVVKECRSYCKVGSTDAQPSGACCAAVSGADFDCLCGFKTSLPKDIDGNRAMQIPNKCSAAAPTKCKNY